ncbi:sel1 repeat family protein [Vibrio sp. Of7-15]|uniref:tetratricopeptide repeat protein n=1 Tax=Vibrio sp. Of7-15 TaxID=2724879 RepID=UPI001EF2C417|nr:tetratricopeptide repeat protein [Vibrio sp. Of7-15]MCG7498343.1 sel1 repeat family protein [Vibrio sp. Of7-15]
MDPILIGVIILVLPLMWFLVRYFSVSKEQERKEVQKQQADDARLKALEEQRAAEKKERVYKAQTGHVPTQMYLAKEAEHTNPKEALYWYEKAAESDNELAMYSVIRLCDARMGDSEAEGKSQYWSKVIKARNGSDEAKFEMGLALMKGDGVEVNVEKGISFIEEVAEKGDLEAQLFMADWHVAEANPRPSPKLSAEWNLKAAENGSIEAQVTLGRQYAEGKGIPANPKKATYWLELAAEAGDVRAQFYAGEMSAETSDDGNAIAYIWFWLAAENGVEEAKTRRDQVGHLMGVDSVIGLQGMAKPLLKKMRAGKITKHTIIKALDKLYERQSYFPDGDNEFMVGEKPSKSDVASSSDSTKKADNTNFSQSKMDK